MANFCQRFDAGLFDISPRFADKIAVDFEANRLGALFGRRDDNASVARTKVINQIARLHPGKIDHLVDNELRRRNVGYDFFGFKN